MTVLDVDTDVYTAAGHALIRAAEAWFTAIDAEWNTLAECGNMTGSYTEAERWGMEYDTRADALITNARQVAEAAYNYGCVLLKLAHVHAQADHAAMMTPGPPPDAPQIPPAPIMVCRVPLPSAGGPGTGLLDDGIGLVEQVGITIPDGDTTLLGRAADTWTKLSTAAEVTGLAAELDRIAGEFSVVTAPEVAHIDEDLRVIKAAADDTVAGFGELGASTAEHRDALVAMRDDLKAVLEDLRNDIALEAAITVAITVVSSLVTFGAASPIGAAIGTSRLAVIVARHAPKVRRLVDAFKLRGLRRAPTSGRDIGRHGPELQRINSMRARQVDEWKPTPPTQLSNADRQVLLQGPSSKDGRSLTAALRESADTGTPLPPAVQRQVDDLNGALGKLPAHEGMLTRHTNLTPEQLAQYRPGATVTEHGFTSATPNPAGANELLAQNSNVEYRILARGKNGHDYSEYGTPDEVLFKSGTDFYVQNVIRLPGGRTRIEMVEM
ncbi:hypothetical protein [Nocardia paucivorans]|uniref:hypothetical protein n=1 Tax=Nocardia paucivorans TaxID=114259 RepID=UPI0002D432C6|nr:hypothetical protein [Nocardia paucivorans]